MDYLSLITEAERYEFAANYAYKTDYLGQQFFTPQKTQNLKVAVRNLVEGGDLPVMAYAHSFDAEAKIGTRVNYEENIYEKVFIKEKINTTERIAEFLGYNPTRDAIIDYIFNDSANMLSRVITRTEVANMELLGTGKVTYNENEVAQTVNYNVNVIATSGGTVTPATLGLVDGWNLTAAADIIGDIEKIKAYAKTKGRKIVRAITSGTIAGYIANNAAIRDIFITTGLLPTQDNVLAWFSAQTGIEFIINDELYKKGDNVATTNRFFPEQTVTFLTTKAALGGGLFGVTPEELMYKGRKNEKALCMLTYWYEEDPCANWVKASALYVPVLADPKGVFIFKHTVASEG